MPPLSADARVIFERMEPDRRYEPPDLRAFVPGISTDGLREAMHELWVNRLVERVHYSGWRRHRSAPPHASDPVRPQSKAVKPEELFDHAAFADFFK